MKYIITDKNIKWDNQYKNVDYFASVEERDNFVNTELQDEYLNTLETQPHVHSMNLGNMEGIVEVEWKTNNMDIRNRNTIILQENAKAEPTFWWIESVENLENNNMFTLNLRKNIFLTDWSVVSKLRDLQMVEGHVPVDNYINYEFYSGEKVYKDYQLLISDDADIIGSGDLYTNAWVLVYVELTDNQEGIEFFTRMEGKSVDEEPLTTRAGITFKQPYKVYAAPLIRRATLANGLKADAQDLLEYFYEVSNSTIIAIKIVNHEFDSPDIGNRSTAMTQVDNDDYNFVEFIRFEPGYSNSINDIGAGYIVNKNNPQNRYTLEIPSDVKSVLELLDGVNEYSLILEGTKDFKIPLKYLRRDNNGKFNIQFRKAITLGPSDSKEAIYFDGNGDSLPLIEPDYTWNNDTELSTKINQLNEYKANNPNAALDYLKPLASFTNPLTYLNPASAVASVVGAVSGEVSTIVQRNSMKRAPQSQSTDGATLFGMSNSLSYGSFLVVKSEFIGQERESTITNTYKNGLQFQNLYNVVDYNSIKRPKFNYLKLTNFKEANNLYEVSQEVIDEFESIFQRGIRLWNEGYKDYDTKWADNGESIEDFTKAIGGNNG